MARLRIKVYPRDGLAHERDGKAIVEISVRSQVSASLSMIPLVFEWTQSKIGGFDAIVGDYLSRHNYQAFDGANEALAIEQAMRDGHQIAEELSEIIADSHAGVGTIISAASLYKDSSFDRRLANFKNQYASNPTLSALIDQAVAIFLLRKLRGIQPDERIRAHCISYQLEELALFELLAEMGYSTLIYSGPHLPVMKNIVTGSLLGVSSTLETLTLVELRINNTQ